jgi:uncharacterized membrane protein
MIEGGPIDVCAGDYLAGRASLILIILAHVAADADRASGSARHHPPDRTETTARVRVQIPGIRNRSETHRVVSSLDRRRSRQERLAAGLQSRVGWSRLSGTDFPEPSSPPTRASERTKGIRGASMVESGIMGGGMMAAMGIWAFLLIATLLAVLVAVVFGTVWRFRRLRQDEGAIAQGDGAYEVMRRRYGAGEIDDEYRHRLTALSQS